MPVKLSLPPPPDLQLQTITAHVRFLTYRLIHLFNTRAYTSHELHELLGVNIQSDYTHPVSMQSEGGNDARHCLEVFKAMTDQYPEWDMQILDATVKVGKRRDEAEVWCTLTVKGHPHMDRQETVSVLRWRQREDLGWICVEHTNARGSPLFME